MQSQTQLPPDVADRLAADRALLHGLRAAIARRIERDLMILDALSPDDDLEDDGDAEPGLCGVGTHDGGSGNLWPGYPREGGNCGGNAEDLEAENEHATEIDGGEDGDDNGIGDGDGLAEQFPPSVIGYSFGLAI